MSGYGHTILWCDWTYFCIQWICQTTHTLLRRIGRESNRKWKVLSRNWGHEMTVSKWLHGPVKTSDWFCCCRKITAVHRGCSGIFKWNTVSKKSIFQWDTGQNLWPFLASTKVEENKDWTWTSMVLTIAVLTGSNMQGRCGSRAPDMFLANMGKVSGNGLVTWMLAACWI